MAKKNDKVVTRFAPSPTGAPHIGSLRNALYNWLFARANKGEFILRIEDTDQERYVKGAEQSILEMLAWTGLDIDGQPVKQSEHKDKYAEYAQQLVKDDKAYYCFCSSERLDKLRKEQEARKERPRYDRLCRDKDIQGDKGESCVIRLKIPEQGETVIKDIVKGQVSFQNSELDDLIILKSDGFPTYHLAHIVDDHESGVTHVIRGDEWLPSLPKHVILYNSLGWELPVFAHLPLILATDKSKLSKRHGAVSVMDFKEQGYLTDALINFVLLLGWHPKQGSKQEIFTRDEMLDQFKLEDVQKSGAIFDYQKLDSINSKYIRQTPTEKLAELAKPFLSNYESRLRQGSGGQAGIMNQAHLIKVIDLEKDRVKKLSELPEALGFIFNLPEYDSKILIWKKSNKESTVNWLTELIKLVEGIDEKNWLQDNIEKVIKEKIESLGLSNGETLWPMRVALSGQENSPGPFEIAHVLGKEETLKRLNQALAKLS